MNRDVRIAALALALSAAAQGVGAIGFGRLPQTATLGQPLDLAIPLRIEAGEVLRSNCLSGQVSFADTPQPPGAVSLRLDPAAPDAGRRLLRLSTVNRVDEPIVTVEISVGCSGKVSRRFTLFADPPSLLPVQAPVQAPPSLAGRETGAAPAAADAAAQPTAPLAAAPGARINDAAPRPRPTTTVRRKPAVRTAAAASRSATATSPSAKPAGSRLQLSPPGDSLRLALLAQAQEAEQRVSAAQSAASAASAAQAAAEARAVRLEAANAALRSQAASAEQALATLRAQLHGERPPVANNTVVPSLLAFIALLLAGLAWLWHQRNQEREANAWLLNEAGADDLGPDEAMPVVTTEPAAAKPLPPGGANLARPAQPPTPSWSGSGPAPLAGVQLAEHKREVSVEELIDLEQQAEFFVVLGQDEAAIDLLMGHLRSTAGNSPLPYLKLLEIYKRRGERKEYERLRERFNSRFTAVAPDWEADLHDGRSLEDYPSVTGRLENLWGRPQSAMEVLQTTLLRADGQRGTRDSFDLPAYRELMLLYAVARDRSESEAGGSVDLLLPIGEEAEGDPLPIAMFERLLATTSLDAQPGVLKPLAVDLHLDDAEETKPAAMQFTSPRDLPEDVVRTDRKGPGSSSPR